MLINDLEYWKTISNFQGKYLGLDRPNHSFQPKGWWENYPVQNFDYNFNEWGFRGLDYSEYIDKPVNICLGDSFTINIGGPIEHSWPSQLSMLLDLPTINLGIFGAGNDAIRLLYDRACKAFDVQNTFVMYSYFQRRLVGNKFAHYGGDEHSKHIPTPLHTDVENFQHFVDHMIPESYEAHIPDWCYTYGEMEMIPFYQHYVYPEGGREEWVNRDYLHMNKELNGKLAEYYYELFSTNT